MPYIRVKYKDGQEWGITNTEVIITAKSLDGVSAQEIGEKVLALAPLVDEFQHYLSLRHEEEYFDSIDEFREELEESLKRTSAKQVSHTPTNDSWQINYEVYTVDDFRNMLVEDSRLQLFRPHVRKAIEALLDNTDSWRDVAKALDLSVYTVQEKIRYAVYEFKKRLANSQYQPKRL